MDSAEEARPPVWQLVEQAAQQLPSPFNTQSVLAWFSDRYPDVPEPTIRAHLSVLTGNGRSYLSHPVFSRRPPILWRIGWGVYEPYDAARHGEPEAATPEADEIVVESEARPPIWRLIEIASRELTAPFAVQDMLDWFAESYPDIPPATVRAQMPALAGNSVAYLSNPTNNQRPPILWRVGRGVYEPYDRARHGEVATRGATDSEPDAEEALESAQEFLLEQYLEQFLFDNWGRINFARPLELWSPDDRSPRQFDAGEAGRLDFLCKDRETDALVVMELKRGTPSDAVIGQTLRYIGWVRENLARPDQRVEGIVVVAESDEKLRLATLATPALELFRYRISFSLEPAAEAN